ncbi:MAG: serine/threonine-protein phosphatase [Deltaproteobacteria bacterium]|nr:serine/threonine-protein phosphatase [Deltaproteobacteria bacterium]
MLIRGAARTDRGKVRQQNEDAFGFFPDAAFYVVADGMGGHVGGQVASTLAVEAMRLSVEETQGEELTPVTDPHGWRAVGWRRLSIAMQQANSKVFETSQHEPTLKGMGTTIASILFDDEDGLATICHVGDSRVYRVRAGSIELLTEDHSLVQQLLREGKIAFPEVKTFPHRHVLTQAVGVSPSVQPAVRVEKPQPGDIFLISSDGMHGTIEATEILEVITQQEANLQRACDLLVDLANARGGSDNSTVILLQYEDPQAKM